MEVSELAEALKVPVVPATPEVQKLSETVQEVVEEPTKTVEAVAKPVVEEVKPSERLQARLDGLTERLYDKEKRISELEKKIEAVQPKAEPVATDEQIQALLNDPAQAQYHGWAANELARRQGEKTKADILNTIQLQSQTAKSYEAAKAEFPEIADTNSELWKKANEIFIAKGLGRDPDGQYIAAVLASRLIAKPVVEEVVSAEVAEKRVAKEAGKKGLVQVSKKVVATVEDKLAKLEKEAFTGGAGSPQMIAYLRELESDRLAKKKNK